MEYNRILLEPEITLENKRRNKNWKNDFKPSRGKVIRLHDSVHESLIRIERLQKQHLKNEYWNLPKRILDIIFSSLVLIFVLSWVFPLLYILIKMESNGPVIFRQMRNGINQEPFECFKFRSMAMNVYSDSKSTEKGDSRVTKIGSFIRKYSLDELPQFLNVLKGDMTIVGPRPHMISETKSFNSISSQFYKRHEVKPGITGLAQISDCRGKINTLSELQERLKFDLIYIKNASLLLDLKIISKTFKKMFFGDKMAF